MLKWLLVLFTCAALMARLPSASMVAEALLTATAWPLASRFASRLLPMAMLPALKISAPSRLFTVPAPMSRRWRAAIVAAPPPSTSLLTVLATMLRWSP
ncbi:hypothetical protein B0E49_15990 [Polaromonas sp. C04]|nr:hypothetical protein B0E49_15990 [Polaromonas sp. C04]